VSSGVEYASFLIRLWRQAGLDAVGNPLDWQSEVEHIQSGQTWTFSSLEALMAFGRQQIEHPEGLVGKVTHRDADKGNG
jgi:hypothetical protein